jgi:lipopolysaccharide export system protein LptA
VQGAIDVKEEDQMTQRGMSFIFTVLAAFALALPIAARGANTNSQKAIVSMSVELSSAATLGGTELKPGSYSVRADSVKVTLLRGGKAIAEAPVQ